MDYAVEGLAGNAELGFVFLIAVFSFVGLDFLNLTLFNGGGDWNWLGKMFFFRYQDGERILMLRYHDLRYHLWGLRL